MKTSRIPSPARSQGQGRTPRREKTKRTRSVGSPASNASARLTSVLEGYKDKNDSFALVLAGRKSVLTDNTDIADEPTRRSWWKKLNENSRDVMEILEDNIVEPNNIMEVLDIEVLSQENQKKNYSVDLPESSDGESINSIVLPQRKLFTQKENQPQKKYDEIMGTRDTLSKVNKNTTVIDKTITAGTKELFQNKKRSKPMFPAALLTITPDKTLGDKIKEFATTEPKGQVRNVFGNRAGTKRKNMFANFIVSESEDEIPDIQPKVFGFPKKSMPQRRGSSQSKRRQRESSPASVTTDIEMDDWKHLPSSTMVEHQFEVMFEGVNSPVKRPRLGKLSETKESEASNKSKANKSGSKNTSMATRSRSRIVSEKNEKDHTLIKNKSQEELNNSVNKSGPKNTSMVTRNRSKVLSEENEKEHTLIQNKSLKEQNNTFSKDNKSNKFSVKDKSKATDDIINESGTSKNTSKQETQSNKSIAKNKSLSTNKSHKDAIGMNEAVINESQHIIDGTEEPNKRLDEDRSDNEAGDSRAAVDHNTELPEADEQIKGFDRSRENVDEIEKQIERSEKKHYESKGKIGQSQRAADKNQQVKDVSDNEANQSQQQNANDSEKDEIHDDIVEEMDQSDKQGDSYNKNDQSQEAVDESQENADDNEADESQKVDQIQQELNESGNKAYHNQQVQDETDNEVDQSQQEQDSSDNEVDRSQQEQNESDNEVDENLQEQDDNKNEVDQSQERDASDNEFEQNQEIVRETEEMDDEQADKSEQVDRSKENYAQSDNEQNETQSDNEENEIQSNNEQNETQSDNEEIEIQSDNEQNETQSDNEENEIQSDNEQNETQSDNEEIEIQSDNEQNETQSDNEENEIQSDNEQNETQSDNEQNETQSDNEQNETQSDNEENEIQSDNEEIELQSDNEQNETQSDNEENEIQSDNEQSDNEENEIQSDNEQNETQSDNEQNETQSDNEQNETQSDNEENETQSDNEQNETQSDNEENEIQSDNAENSERSDNDENDAQNYNDAQNVEVDYENETDENTNQDSNQKEIVENSQNISHDTTGRNRQKHQSPGQNISFSTRRNTSLRRTSMVKNMTAKASLAPQRDSVGFSDGIPNSSAEGSGWDSHRTTRKTIRQTFGKDFSIRKSLRTLVMEKSAKRQTLANKEGSETAKFPLANSTELPEMSNMDYDDHQESTHELSLRTKQMNIEAYFEKIKLESLERRTKLEEAVINSLKKQPSNPFKVPARPLFPRKPLKTINKVKKQPILENLPEELIADMQYKPPKRFRPANAAWITKRLYKFLETKLEPKYDYKARVRSEKLVETIYQFTKDLRRQKVASTESVDALKHEMARLDIVKTHYEFYDFFHLFMPREVRIKVNPDVVNKIPLPKDGIFADIIAAKPSQG